MLSFVRRRLTFANVAMTLALVFAMSGGALAASKFLITSTKQIKPSVLSSLKGKAGRAGTTGAQGPVGPAGVTGPQGPAGPGGPAGAVGAKGEDGTSVTSASASKSECSEGGTKFTSASGTSKACNGKEGSPWTAGGTLPSGKTETGTWTFGPYKLTGTEVAEGIVTIASFPIPLAAPLANGHAHFINPDGMEQQGSEEITPTECGSAIGPEANASNPQAKPGNLCVYAAELDNASLNSEAINSVAGGGSVGRTGAVALFGVEGSHQEASGAWAVTAE
jgi:hypothetical protein